MASPCAATTPVNPPLAHHSRNAALVGSAARLAVLLLSFGVAILPANTAFAQSSGFTASSQTSAQSPVNADAAFRQRLQQLSAQTSRSEQSGTTEPQSRTSNSAEVRNLPAHRITNENSASRGLRPPSTQLKPAPQPATHDTVARSTAGVQRPHPSPTIQQLSAQQPSSVALSSAPVSDSSPSVSSGMFLDLTHEDQSTGDTQAIAEPTGTDMILRLATWTIIILCLCVLTVLGIRRWQRNHGMLPLSQGHSQVLETVMIGPNRSVSLVRLRDIQAIVGCDASGIQSIVLAPPSFDSALAETDTEPELFTTDMGSGSRSQQHKR